MKIKSIEQRIKLMKLVSFLVFGSAIIMVSVVSFFAYNITSNAERNIYVLDNGIPIVANRTNILDNREVEKKAHINKFHTLFFTLTPDDEYIKSQIEEALYLIDVSGFNEHINLKERGYYNSILSSNSVITISTDSIVLNDKMDTFTFYAKQKITRRTSIIYRELITEGSITDIPRSQNNSHGIMIKGWNIKSNKNISEQKNYNQ